MKKDSLGDRMKGNYEDRFRTFLPRRMPLILRLDAAAEFLAAMGGGE